MDEQQIRALVESMLTAAKTELTDAMHAANQGLAANLSKQIAKIETKPKATKAEESGQPAGDGESPLSMKALQTQLAELQKSLEAEKSAAFAAASESALTNAIASSGTNNPNVLKKLLQAEYNGKLKQESGGWFVVDGDNAVSLNDAVKGYLGTDDGKFFLPPSGTKGSGSVETKPSGAIAGTAPQSLEQQLEAAFKSAK